MCIDLNIDYSQYISDIPIIEEIKVVCIKDYIVKIFDIKLPPDNSIRYKTVFHKDTFYTLIKQDDFFTVSGYYDSGFTYENVTDYFISMPTYREMRIDEILED